MLIVLSQPFFRQRHAVHGVTPTCSSHRDKLTTAAPGVGCVLPFDSILTRHRLPCDLETVVYHKHGLSARLKNRQVESVHALCPVASMKTTNCNPQRNGIRMGGTYRFRTGARLTPRRNEVFESAQWTQRNHNGAGQMGTPVSTATVSPRPIPDHHRNYVHGLSGGSLHSSSEPTVSAALDGNIRNAASHTAAILPA